MIFLGFAAVASETENHGFFCKEKFPLFKNGHFIFVLFFGARPFLFPIFILCGTKNSGNLSLHDERIQMIL